METIHFLFGQGKELNILQMSLRAVVIFIITLVLIRISGRRSFGMRMPFDNIITILLGAILSRAVTGSSPFFPVIAAAAVIVLLHRLFAWISIHNEGFSKLIAGEKRLLYKDGIINNKNMEKSLMCEKDLLQELRINGNISTLEKIDEAYCERNGEVSIIKKEQ